MFRSRFIHTIDSKNRMSLPAEYRAALQRHSKQPPMLTVAREYLQLFPYDDWERHEAQLLGMRSVRPEVEAYVRVLISSATPCPVDKQGRILIPGFLRDHAGLEREVAVLGVGERIQLWDKARLERNDAHTFANFDEIARIVDSRVDPRSSKGD